ncbi:MAG: hypothetical protein ACR2NP_12940 [Pirellulaceae bacterium]
MPKPIAFSYRGTESKFSMNKIDRSRLYGYKELEVLDDDGKPCSLATLADDGRTLVGLGGTGIGYMTADGKWCSKEELRPVDLEGNTIEPVKSSFNAPIPLTEEVSFDEYMDHSIRLIYQLDLPEGGEHDDLIGGLRNGKIFKFDYSYRGGLEADTGFLLANEANDIFLLIGDATDIEFIGLQQPTALPVSDGEEADDDLMDFGMI